MTETNLPDAATLIEAAREAMRGVQPVPRDPLKAAEKRRHAASRMLDQWAPGIDRIVGLAEVAGFLGLRGPDALRRRQWRVRADGSRDWPEPDVEFGQSRAGHVKGWKLRTIVLHQAEAPGRGHHALRVETGSAPVYLSAGDIADHFGVATNTVHSWRTRYGPGRPADAIAKAPVCPQPDVYVGVGAPQAGWRQDRMPEWEAWRLSLPGSGAGGVRPGANDGEGGA